ncbi:MAG: hypothetical protein HQL14_08070 [Candidatus Omnitrophica bacterium]|nr:hypothetical protein [Candidatus Omnitrophota bacterium]
MGIEAEIDGRIHKCGKGYREWYVGTTADPNQRLFKSHNVSQEQGAWIYRDAGSEMMAKNIEAVFLKKGCKGGSVGGIKPHYVYAYRMTRTTRGI